MFLCVSWKFVALLILRYLPLEAALNQLFKFPPHKLIISFFPPVIFTAHLKLLFKEFRIIELAKKSLLLLRNHKDHHHIHKSTPLHPPLSQPNSFNILWSIDLLLGNDSINTSPLEPRRAKIGRLLLGKGAVNAPKTIRDNRRRCFPWGPPWGYITSISRS
jgi:hypothetical protein